MRDNSNNKMKSLCKYSSPGLEPLLVTKCSKKNATSQFRLSPSKAGIIMFILFPTEEITSSINYA